MEYYGQHGRELPWRPPELSLRPDNTLDAYAILVSEIMLQQTQVSRVVPRYRAFLARFPDIRSLAGAPLADVLTLWSGLGYNRRARYLWLAAQALADELQPWTHEKLVACPGIGPHTAAAILVYSYDAPLLFLETNIKTVLIHQLFSDKEGISDQELLAALESVVPWHNRQAAGSAPSPRVFYWGMMDYGAHIKATVGNLSRRSKGYVKQSRFAGSRRAVRGQVLRLLTAGPLSRKEVRQVVTDERLDEVVEALQKERLISVRNELLMLYNETQQ